MDFASAKLRKMMVMPLLLAPATLVAGAFLDEKYDKCLPRFALLGLNPERDSSVRYFETQLATMREHVVETNFAKRGKYQDKVLLRSFPKKMRAAVKGFVTIERYDKDAPSVTGVRIRQGKEVFDWKAPNADEFNLVIGKGIQNFPYYVTQPNRRRDLIKDVPEGYRVKIRNNSDFKSKGFHGGHTRAAWEKTRKEYGSLIEITSEDTLSFRLADGGPTLRTTTYRYKFDGKQITVPKTVVEVESGTERLSNLEEQIASALAEKTDKGNRERLATLDIPVTGASNGKNTIRVTVARTFFGNIDLTPNNIGWIEGWWLNVD